MDAGPLLAEVGRRINAVNLEAILIGNAAAALRGAPVTTIDFDLLFRKSSRNLVKLKTIARGLRAPSRLATPVSVWPHSPISSRANVPQGARATWPCWTSWR